MKKLIVTIGSLRNHKVTIIETEGDLVTPRDIRNIGRAIAVQYKKHRKAASRKNTADATKKKEAEAKVDQKKETVDA